jgi:uncharacterized membrane protein
MPWIILQSTLIILCPYLFRQLARHLPGWLSPVVLCYALGIILGNVPLFPLDAGISTLFSELTIIMAIPLLLYGTHLKQWLRYARGSFLSFGLCLLSGLIATSLAAYLLHERVPDSWRIAGMLVGVYTGGTPNMQAIGLALEAPQATIILLNTTEMLIGAIYLLFLISLAPRIYGWLLPPFKPAARHQEPEAAAGTTSLSFHYRDSLKAIGLTLLIIGTTLGITLAIFGGLQQIAFLLLLLTSLSIAASFLPAVRGWRNTFETGEYFLLMFCIALGMLADFSEIVAQGFDLLGFTAFAMLGMAGLHLLLAYLFKIDRDTLLFTSVAAIYGPAFIGQIASVTGNRQLVFSGVAMGLLGYALGNYLGISLAYLLRQALGG